MSRHWKRVNYLRVRFNLIKEGVLGLAKDRDQCPEWGCRRHRDAVGGGSKRIQVQTPTSPRASSTWRQVGENLVMAANLKRRCNPCSTFSISGCWAVAVARTCMIRPMSQNKNKKRKARHHPKEQERNKFPRHILSSWECLTHNCEKKK